MQFKVRKRNFLNEKKKERLIKLIESSHSAAAEAALSE